MYGSAEKLKVKIIKDYVDGNIEQTINDFFAENPHAVIIDIKYFNLVNVNDGYTYHGHETAMIVYKN